MLLSRVTQVKYFPDNEAHLFLPIRLLSMINIQPETHPEVFAYICETRFRELRMPDYKEMVFSPIELNPNLVLCRISVVDKPGKFRNLTHALRDKNINIQKANGTIVGKRGICEMYLDFSEADIQTDELVKELETLVNKNILFDYSSPEPLSEVLGVKPFSRAHFGLELKPVASNPLFAQIALKKQILHSLSIDWVQSKKEGQITSAAIISIYSRFPMLISTFLRPDQKLLYVRVKLKDVIGALYETLKAISDFATIYSSNTIQMKGKFTSWEAFVFLFDGTEPGDVEKALQGVGDKFVEKRRICVNEIAEKVRRFQI